MPENKVHKCECVLCQSQEDHPNKRIHHQINLLISRLNEQQKRWYAALEANRIGHGGIKVISEITGLDEKTINRGQKELDQQLKGRPTDRIRLGGAGHPPVEKKSRDRKFII